MKPYWRDELMNKELEQALNERYGEVLDLTNEEIYDTVCSLFESNETSEKILLENNFDSSSISNNSIEYFKNNCDIITQINANLYKVKNINDECPNFDSKDDEIEYLKSKLEVLTNEVTSIEKSITTIMNNDTHMIQNYLALHSLYALDNYSSNLAINMVVETSSQGIDIIEKTAYINGYSSASLDTKTILNRIDRLDNDLSREIQNK